MLVGERLESPSSEAALAAWMTERDLGLWAWLLGDLLCMGVPIQECFRTCCATFHNPRLLWINASVHDATRDGKSFAGVLSKPPFVGSVDPMLVALVDAGEASNELDRRLIQYAQTVLFEDTLAQAIGRTELTKRFVKAMATLHAAGLPILTSLRTLARSAEFADLATYLTNVAEAVSDGKALSVALAADGCALLRPDSVFFQLVRCGEQGHVLESTFRTLADQGQPIRMRRLK